MPAGLRVMRRLAQNVLSPYYVLRPGQLLARVGGELRAGGERRFVLPWGARIVCDTSESIGLVVQQRGLYDLTVCETLLRLTDPGELALDVGANFGHMTSLLAHAVGASGRVVAFEPHPQVFGLLDRNARQWAADGYGGAVELRQEAVSDVEGAAELSTDVFDVNWGSASLEPLTQERHTPDVHRVRLRRLDDLLGADERVGVMKIDIEGHELHAFQGAHDALAAGRIRDIVLEERAQPPTPVTRLLAEHGYALMRIGQRLRGPTAGRLEDGTIRPGFGDDPSLLATRAPERALERLGLRGWAVYRTGAAGREERRRRPDSISRSG